MSSASRLALLKPGYGWLYNSLENILTELEDLKAYIESGILELYVLGDVSPDQKLQVQAMTSKHPAIKAELDEIERAMESYAEANAVEPPEYLRDRIVNSTVTNLADDRAFTKKEAEKNDNIVALPVRQPGNFYKYAFAACLALLLASVIALSVMYGKLQESNNQIAALSLDKQHFAGEVRLMDQQLVIFRDASFKILKLQGTAHAPSAQLTVAWSPAKKKVMIDMASAKMPVNDNAHQYQLWALVAGKPVDLGVFDERPDSLSMKEMKSIASADAFAVTLEPRGGSVSPTMDQLMVLGKF